ncbi:MAG: Rpn family recombination-promoting nuclease/putative transposase [Clostridiales Family XIII bacterium]|jgi:predicted transposase/invertase (TIGR01784 family)|nr:Rpn family recombination-promoting nuclease/putative transposase [Clostridiales Family XIII bacterium]
MGLQILSPRSDFIFKRIFGDAKNTDILAAFLRSVLDLPESEYDRLTIIDPHLMRDTADGKLGILDVKLHTKSKKVIDIEIQILETPEMRERIAFYLAKMVTEQIGKSEDYAAIKKTVCILITNYALIKENKAYHNRYTLYDPKTASEFTDVMEVDVLELRKLRQGDGTELGYWMQFLKSDREEELAMLAQRSPQMKKAVGVLMELSADERTRMLYDAHEKALRDEKSRLRGAEKNRTNEIARKLLNRGRPIEEIVEDTGLSREEIEALRGNN